MASGTNERQRGGGNGLAVGACVAVVVLCGFQFWWANRLQDALEANSGRSQDLAEALATLEATAAQVEEAALQVKDLGNRLDRIDARLAPLEVVGDEWEFVAPDVSKIFGELGELRVGIEQVLGVRLGEITSPQPAQIDWTQPELFDAARKAGAEYGITLTADEVRVPCRIAIREGVLEYFAVLKGGKEHEALVALVGNDPSRQERRPQDFAARLNNAIQALGFRRGTPVRFTPRGPVPAAGETVYLFLEYEYEGRTIVAHAEDLVWNRLTGRPMERGKWVYIGSRFEEDEPGGEVVYVPDLTGEVVATYSTRFTMIDNVTDGAADDTVFLAATPRIPEGLDALTLVIRRTDLDTAFEFPAPPLPDDGVEDDGEDR